MHKKLLFAIIAAIATTNAYSDQVLTSRAYVDDADAQKVNIAQGVGTNNANVGKTLVVNSSGNLELGTVSADNFVEDDITDGVTNKAPSENAVHDALENKQNTIATDMVDFNDGVADLPAIVTYDSTDGVTGNKIGILDQETIAGDEGDLRVYNTNEYGAQMDNYVPTVRAVADEVNNIWNSMPNRRLWSSSLQTPINNYSTTFSTASDTWPKNQQNHVPTIETFANGLALKQNKIPAGTAGNVVTYTGTAGTVGSVPTANAPTYNATTGALTNGTSIATIAAVDTKQNKMTCTRWLNNIETDENCLLWELGN
jgi:hypothetical protein